MTNSNFFALVHLNTFDILSKILAKGLIMTATDNTTDKTQTDLSKCFYREQYPSKYSKEPTLNYFTAQVDIRNLKRAIQVKLFLRDCMSTMTYIAFIRYLRWNSGVMLYNLVPLCLSLEPTFPAQKNNEIRIISNYELAQRQRHCRNFKIA